MTDIQDHDYEQTQATIEETDSTVRPMTVAERLKSIVFDTTKIDAYVIETIKDSQRLKLHDPFIRKLMLWKVGALKDDEYDNPKFIVDDNGNLIILTEGEAPIDNTDDLTEF